jgi:hypothetical protein
MTTNFGKSTYKQIIDDISFDFPEREKVSEFPPETLRRYICEAEEDVTRRITVKDARDLRLILGMEEYPFVDSTDIVGTGLVTATAGSNMVTGPTVPLTGFVYAYAGGATLLGAGTAFLTEVSVGDHIIVGAETRTVLSVPRDNALLLTLPWDNTYEHVVGVTSVTQFLNELIIGATVKIGGETKVVTSVTDDFTLTVDSAFTSTHTLVAFTYSPRSTELSTEIKTADYIDRLEQTIYRQPTMETIETLLSQRQVDFGVPVYTNYNNPVELSIWSQGGRRYLRCYPAPDEDKTITLYVQVTINPRIHTADTNASYIHVPSKYDHAIKQWLKAVMMEHLKDDKSFQKYMTLYADAIRQLGSNPDSRKKMRFSYC